MLTVVIRGSFSEAKSAIHEANRRGEAIEFRLDLFDDLSHVSKLKGLCSLPVIFTLRKKSQGGAFEGNEREREEKLIELLALNPDYVDLEYDCDPTFVQKVRKMFPDVAIICSFHDFEKTPENLGIIFEKISNMRAAIYKMATFANSSLDSLRMLTFIQSQRKNEKNVAGMCMGMNGEITRILAPIVDNLLTYASLSSEQETAPGQVSLDILEKIYHTSRLNRQTAIYALIGDPVDKSIGHLAHNHFFEKLKLDAVYVKIAIKSGEVSEFFHLIKQLPFKGFSVTMPLKEEVSAHLDSVAPKAKSMGAINTLVLTEGKWEGFNTDAEGALDAIETKGKVSGKKIVILGAGGAARALAFESMQRGGEVLIINRTKAKAERIAKQLGCEGVSLEEWQMLPFDILMNTTPVGMEAQSSESLITEDSIPSDATVFDAVIKPKETYLLNIAKNKGCQVVYGYEMFARQAIKQFKLWFNQPFEEGNLLQDIDQIYHEEMSS